MRPWAGLLPALMLMGCASAAKPAPALPPMTAEERAQAEDYYYTFRTACEFMGVSKAQCDREANRAGCAPSWTEAECGRHMKSIKFLETNKKKRS